MSLAPEISIIIPVYNDAAHIGKSIDALKLFIETENLNAEIIIINDGGEDATAKIVEDKIKMYEAARFINRRENKGKGYSVREGIRAASGKFMIFTDADLPYGTKYFKTIIEKLKSDADLVLANRNLRGSPANQKNLSILRKLTHWGFAFLVRRLLNLEFTDTQAGLKGIKKEASSRILPKLKIDRYAFDLELLLAAKKAGLKIKEIPVVLENVGQSNINVFKDSFQMFKDILKIYFSI